MLSPSGLGADTFRNMEALILSGTVPIQERGFGLERAWSKLPVVWVDEYATMTLEQLQQAWAEVIYNRPHYDFTHITERFWFEDVFERLCATGDAAFLDDEFPELLPQYRYTRLMPASEWVECWPEIHPDRNDTLVRRCKKGGVLEKGFYKEWKLVS